MNAVRQEKQNVVDRRRRRRARGGPGGYRGSRGVCRVVRSAVCVSFHAPAFSRLIGRPGAAMASWLGAGSHAPVTPTLAETVCRTALRRALRRAYDAHSVAHRARQRADAEGGQFFIHVRRRVLAVIYAKERETFARTGHLAARSARRALPQRATPRRAPQTTHTMGAAESHTAKKQVNVDEAKEFFSAKSSGRRRQARDPAPDLLLEGGRRGRGGHGDLRLLLRRREGVHWRVSIGAEARRVPHAGTGRQVPGQVHATAPAAGRRVVRG